MTALPALLLVAEASEPVRAAVAGRLSERGHRVAVARDGPEALVLAAAERPDGIVLGADLPGLGAEGALARLAAEEGLAGVPLIVLVTGADRHALLEALRDGAHDAVGVPVDLDELDARVTAALRVTARHAALEDANRRLAEQALTDDLTGLANRRHGEHQLARAVALAVRSGQDVGVVRVDVDHFKAINDSHGHQAGDRVLAEVGRRLAAAVRGGDELARWGGDEFVALLPGTDRSGVRRAAERMRAGIAAAPIGVDGSALTVTISAGWAHWAGDTPGDLLARADRALYAAKDAGRNTVRPV